MSLSPEELQKLGQEVVRLADQKRQEHESELDWSGIDLPQGNGRIPQSGLINGKDLVQFRVICKLLGKTGAQVVQTAVITYLRRNWKEHLKMLDFVAAREGLSREEALKQIFLKELEP